MTPLGRPTLLALSSRIFTNCNSQWKFDIPNTLGYVKMWCGTRSSNPKCIVMIQVQDCVSEFVNFNVGVREANSKGLAIQWKLQWSPYTSVKALWWLSSKEIIVAWKSNHPKQNKSKKDRGSEMVLFNGHSPKVGAHLLVKLEGLCHRHWQFDSKRMHLRPTSAINFLYGPIPLVQRLAHPPSKCQLFGNHVGNSVLHHTHRVRLFPFWQWYPAIPTLHSDPHMLFTISVFHRAITLWNSMDVSPVSDDLTQHRIALLVLCHSWLRTACCSPQSD